MKVAKCPLNVLDVTDLASQRRLYYVTNLYSVLTHFRCYTIFCILRAVMQILSNAYIQGSRYVPE